MFIVIVIVLHLIIPLNLLFQGNNIQRIDEALPYTCLSGIQPHISSSL
jgi:hypothetical protein